MITEEIYFIICDECKTIIGTEPTEVQALSFEDALRDEFKGVYCGYKKCVKAKHDDRFAIYYPYDHFRDDPTPEEVRRHDEYLAKHNPINKG